MESDIAQIKILPWIILGLLALCVASNILCRLFNCGRAREIDVGAPWQRGEADALIDKTRLQLQEQPYDISALRFGIKALATVGTRDSARAYARRIMLIEPALHATCKERLAPIDTMGSEA